MNILWTSRIEQYLREGRTVSGGKDETAKNAEISSNSFMKTLQSAFSSQFANQAGILGFLNNKLQAGISNPQGASPQALAAERTMATEGVAKDFAHATVAAQDQIAAHGGNGLPSGVDAQIRGQIAGQAATANSGAQNDITIANENLRQSNYWNAVKGETGVASLEDPLGYAGGSNNAAGAVAGLSNAYTSSDVFGNAIAGGLGTGIGSALGGGWKKG